MMRKKWILVNIGCIECGVESNIVGVFSNRDKAESVAEFLNEKHHWRQGGQNHYQVFQAPPMNKITNEYAKALYEYHYGEGASEKI